MDEGDHKSDRLTTALTTGKKSVIALSAAWVLMLIVGLIPFLYGTGIVAGLLLRALGNPSLLSLLDSPPPGVPDSIFLTETDLTTFFWGLFIITVAWKGLRAGARWAWYLLMFVPIYYAAHAAVDWPIDASLRLFLISLSTAAVVLPIGYFMGHQRGARESNEQEHQTKPTDNRRLGFVHNSWSGYRVGRKDSNAASRLMKDPPTRQGAGIQSDERESSLHEHYES